MFLLLEQPSKTFIQWWNMNLGQQIRMNDHGSFVGKEEYVEADNDDDAGGMRTKLDMTFAEMITRI